MAMRLQELHPALVHLPIALLPTALAADTIGLLSGNATMMEMGRRLMPIAAASAAVAGMAGLVAQESSHIPKEVHPYLITHRNLNLGLIGILALLAQKRARRKRPSLGYLLAGVGGLATMTYTAYLGGHMVYEHGVGVKPAGGLQEEKAPELRSENPQEVLELSLQHLRRGWSHAMKHLEEGMIAPVLSEGANPEQSENTEGSGP